MSSKIDFYDLPRPVQDRFTAASRSLAPPSPLLFRRAPRTTAWAYLASSAALLFGSAIVMCIGWGQVQSPVALHGVMMLFFDGLVLALATYCVLHAVGLLLAVDALPFRAGTYLFPGCAIDARGPVLRVWPVGDAVSIERIDAPPGLALVMRDGARVVVPAESVGDAVRAEAALETLRRELARAIAEGDPRVLAELDPLHDRAMSSPIGPTEAMKHRVAAWMRFDWAIALAAGFALGHVVGTTRNALSDDAMYRAVVRSDDAGQYRLYLAQRGQHLSEIRDVLLPRTDLREAESNGSIDTLQAFAQANPSSRIGPEIDAALRRAMLAELERAKKPGTLAALDAFARRYPEPRVGPELTAARHALYVRALDAWRQSAAPDAATDAFFERLLMWTEQHGPTVYARFRLFPSTSMEDADKSIRRSGHYPGPEALASNYVTPDSLHLREQRVTAALVEAFAQAFPNDVLAMRAGDTLAGDPSNASLPEVTLPTLVIDYSPEWSRGNTACPKPSTVFVGLVFMFNTTFVLPDGTPLKIPVRTWRAAETWKIKPDTMPLADFEGKVYSAMMDSMFEQVQRKLKDTLL